MPPAAPRPQLIRFGGFELDLRSGELSSSGSRFRLPNQPLRILTALIRRPGMLVTRDELRGELWPDDTFVDFEHSLNAGVRRLREALADSASLPRFIETVPQRGYRFIAAVEESPKAEPSSVAGDAMGRAEPARVPSPLRLPVTAATALVAFGALLVVGLGLRGRSSAVAGQSNRTPPVKVTSTSGLNLDPALSPDGTLLAYASDRSGAEDFDIYAQSVAGADPLRLTDDAADESEPAFSPDGARLVFSRRDSGLFVVGALGGRPRRIVRERWARTPRFSPDGRWVSYWTGFPASVVAGGVPGALGSIFVVSADGGEPREIATPLASARYPIWSPDGARILFLGEEDPERKTHDWYVIPWTGGAAVKTEAVDALRAAGLRGGIPIPGGWSARGDFVIFATNETDSSSIWQVAVSRSTGRVIGAPEPLTLGSAIERGASVSDSGRVAYASLVENVDVWRVAIDTKTGEAKGALERLTDNPASDRLRSVSADGMTVSYISSRGTRNEVWMKHLRTGREEQVTHAGVDEASASPDASRVAFSGSDAGQRYIDVLDLSEGLPAKVCDRCSAPGGWSPDGARLLYAMSSPSRLQMYDSRTGGRTEFLSHPAWILDRPRFSPDGRWVAFHTANSPNVRRVFAVPAAGGPVSADAWVPVVEDHGCHPSWSADGTRLYHFSFRDGSFCAWVQRVDPATKRPIGAPRAVQHLHRPRLRAASGAAAFNDLQAGYLYLTLTEATGNIWMLERR